MDGAKIHMAVNYLLECSVCLQVFQDPRILPCGHTFCLQCIQKTNNRLCALCKREWSFPANGFQGLPKNFSLESFIISLPSISLCAKAGDSIHGPVELFCIGCWEPLCTKCGQEHAQFNTMTSNHVVKKITEIDQSDIEIHNRKRTLFCNQHKDKPIEFHCTNCDKFVCCSCYILFHNKHDCVSVEDADTNLCVQINDSKEKIQKQININDEKIKTGKLFEETLENEKSTLLREVQTLVNNVKGKLQIEYEKIVGTIDEYYLNIVKLIHEKTDEEKEKLEKTLKETQTTLQKLQEAMSSIKKYAVPSSNVIERALFLKNNVITQLNNTPDVSNYRPCHPLLDLSQWKVDMNDWLQLLTKALLSVRVLPPINSKNAMTILRFACFI